MGADLFIERERHQVAHFRDAYNGYSIMDALGLSWEDLRSRLDDGGRLPVEHVRWLLDEVRRRRPVPPTRSKWRQPALVRLLEPLEAGGDVEHFVPAPWKEPSAAMRSLLGEAPPWKEVIADKHERLVDFLEEALSDEHNRLVCSL